ncbi:unnamed protein product [Heligmosomoides polygyrus]|uniref:Integrase n=1 Tax=Heligmosomoides polygyrus TaxID=6339 RepID=A0A183GQ21_HELPZ|nr:unnamed protein product [Heligmosomoides polygyrus]
MKAIHFVTFFQNSVTNAAEHGTNDHDLKRLVEDYLERAMRYGMIKTDRKYAKPRMIAATTAPPRTRTFSSRLIHENGFRPSVPWAGGYSSYRRRPQQIVGDFRYP